MHYFVTEMCTCVQNSVTKWYIVGYLSGALWDLLDDDSIFFTTKPADVAAM